VSRCVAELPAATLEHTDDRGRRARREPSHALALLTAELSSNSYALGMRLVDDDAAAGWLQRLRGEPSDFNWDTGNRTKNRKPGVEAADVEGTFQGPTVFLGRIVAPVHGEDRWLLLGQDPRGRQLALVLTRRGDRLRPISCRPMRPKERRIYEEALHARTETEGEGPPA